MGSSGDFFVPVKDRLSQGDILEQVPWGLISSPFTICRPKIKAADRGVAEYAPAPVVDAPKAWAKGDVEALHAHAHRGLALVLWHDCQIDKWLNQGKSQGKAFAAVVPVLPLSLQQTPEMREGIRAGDRGAYFFIPESDTIPESYADFRHIWSVKQDALEHRVHSIGDDAVASLHMHLFTFLTRRRLPTQPVACPTCGRGIGVDDLLEDSRT